MHCNNPCILLCTTCTCSLAQVGIFGKAIGSYVESQWGLAQFALPNESPCSCAFVGDKRTVVGELFYLFVCLCLHFSSFTAICLDGRLYKNSFTLEGNCFRDSFDMFLDISSNDM